MSAYVLYMELIIMWIQAVYLTALKDYLNGVVVFVVSTFILLYTVKLAPSLLMIVSMNFGILTSITIMQTYLQKFLKGKEHRFFEFISYFDKYPSLFFMTEGGNFQEIENTKKDMKKVLYIYMVYF